MSTKPWHYIRVRDGFSHICNTSRQMSNRIYLFTRSLTQFSFFRYLFDFFQYETSCCTCILVLFIYMFKRFFVPDCDSCYSSVIHCQALYICKHQINLQNKTYSLTKPYDSVKSSSNTCKTLFANWTSASPVYCIPC